MGGEKRVGKKDNKIVLYSPQSEIVINNLENNGVCFSKKKYVVKKYEESAPIFVAAYDWFIMEAKKYVQMPQGAEYPYWAFKDLNNIDQSTGNKLLEIQVPKDEVIFFDMYDWNKILCLEYIGETDEDEEKFQQMLEDRGIKRAGDIILTNFHPDLKRQVEESWKRLFRHHEDIMEGKTKAVESIQAGLWQLRKEWIV